MQETCEGSERRTASVVLGRFILYFDILYPRQFVTWTFCNLLRQFVLLCFVLLFELQVSSTIFFLFHHIVTVSTNPQPFQNYLRRDRTTPNKKSKKPLVIITFCYARVICFDQLIHLYLSVISVFVHNPCNSACHSRRTDFISQNRTEHIIYFVQVHRYTIRTI